MRLFYGRPRLNVGLSDRIWLTQYKRLLHMILWALWGDVWDRKNLTMMLHHWCSDYHVKLRVNFTSQRKFIYAEKLSNNCCCTEHSKRPSKIKDLKVGTWNVLSLYTRSGVLRNLVEVTQEYGIDLLVLQEVRWLGKTILEKKICMVYTSSHDKRNCFKNMGYEMKHKSQAALNTHNSWGTLENKVT
jgi:hypothetical protein